MTIIKIVCQIMVDKLAHVPLIALFIAKILYLSDIRKTYIIHEIKKYVILHGKYTGLVNFRLEQMFPSGCRDELL